MKKYGRILGAVLMALMMLCGSALADASVTYEGGAEKFVFLPGTVTLTATCLKISRTFCPAIP